VGGRLAASGATQVHSFVRIQPLCTHCVSLTVAHCATIPHTPLSSPECLHLSHTVSPAGSRFTRSRKLLEANGREHCARLIVAVYTRRLESTQHFYTLAERVCSDSIYQPIFEVFKSVYPTARQHALDGKVRALCRVGKPIEFKGPFEPPTKIPIELYGGGAQIREFVHAVRGYQDSEKFVTFGRFMGYDLRTSYSVRHYYFYCELLDCLKRLTVRKVEESGWSMVLRREEEEH
jgi:hypothetical protein